MENLFIESLIFEHQTLCELDSFFVEFTEGYMMNNGRYLIEEADSKSQNIFTKLINMIKNMLNKIKKFFFNESDEKKDIAVKKMEKVVEDYPELKNKTEKVIDPQKVMKLSKEDLKKGAKSLIPCIISISIPTAILIYKNKTYKKEAQELKNKIEKLNKQINEQKHKIENIIAKSKNRDVEQAKKIHDVIVDRNEIAKKHNDLADKYTNQTKTLNSVIRKHNDQLVKMKEQDATIKQLEEKNNKLIKSLDDKSKENLNFKEELNTAKNELNRLTEDLTVANQQLELLEKFKKQVEEIATGKTLKNKDAKSNISKASINTIKYIYNTIKNIYKLCNQKVSDEQIINDIKRLYNSDETSLLGISDNDIKKASDDNKKSILYSYEKIQQNMKYIKKELDTETFNIFIKDFNPNETYNSDRKKYFNE